MQITGYFAGVLGLALLVALGVRVDLAAMLHALGTAGVGLLWLLPVRACYLSLYALGWSYLLRPTDPERRAGLGYLLWVTCVRDAVDRLLPVASVGGSVIGIRLLRWRGLNAAAVGASVVIEILLTLLALCLFTGIGLLLFRSLGVFSQPQRRVLLVFALCLPAPAIMVLLLNNGAVFQRLQRLLRGLLGAGALTAGAAALDCEIRAGLRRAGTLIVAGALQFAALVLGSFEVWFALRLFGHPVGVGSAVVLESMTQALRHIAFIIPAGLGVQEASLVMFGHSLGIGSDLAIAVSMTKRIRELMCGLPSLLSWQFVEGRRIQNAARSTS